MTIIDPKSNQYFFAEILTNQTNNSTTIDAVHLVRECAQSQTVIMDGSEPVISEIVGILITHH